jgi:hypothetical protein
MKRASRPDDQALLEIRRLHRGLAGQVFLTSVSIMRSNPRRNGFPHAGWRLLTTNSASAWRCLCFELSCPSRASTTNGILSSGHKKNEWIEMWSRPAEALMVVIVWRQSRAFCKRPQ